MIGGMFLQILIQAVILRMILILIAKHEADTSFPKAAMVAAGISVGVFVIGIMTQKFGVFVTIPAQIAFMAMVLMTFCWISLAKSIIVVLIYSAVHFLMMFLMTLLIRNSMKQSLFLMSLCVLNRRRYRKQSLRIFLWVIGALRGRRCALGV